VYSRFAGCSEGVNQIIIANKFEVKATVIIISDSFRKTLGMIDKKIGGLLFKAGVGNDG
jgi:hypothetical protein